MRQVLGLYELRQYGATCVQAPRCHHTVIPQCVAPTHSKKKNRSFCSTSIIDKPKKLRLSLSLKSIIHHPSSFILDTVFAHNTFLCFFSCMN